MDFDASQKGPESQVGLEHIDEHFKNCKLLNKFIWLMSQEDPLCILKVAKFLQKVNDMRQKEIQLRPLNK